MIVHALMLYFVIVVAIEAAYELHQRLHKRRQRKEWERTHEGLNWHDWKHTQQ